MSQFSDIIKSSYKAAFHEDYAGNLAKYETWTITEILSKLPAIIEELHDSIEKKYEPYLTITSDEPFVINEPLHNGSLEYSLDTVEWYKLPSKLEVPKKVYLRGSGNNFVNRDYIYPRHFIEDGSNVVCSGSVLTLLDPTVTRETKLSTSAFTCLFARCDTLVTAPELPSINLGEQCFDRMFRSCDKLVNAPKLPALKLEYACYCGMFMECTSLTTAPKLPARKLGLSCYMRMFKDCTSLTKAPELPASELKYRCYNEMFARCTSLTEEPKISAKKLADYCYEDMFEGCELLVKAQKLSAT